MNKSILSATVVAVALLAGTPVLAEQIRVPVGSQGGEAEMPQRGMNKTRVEAVFGMPDSKNGPTGDPPIYYWEYPTFTVYFESDYVLHTVSKQITASN